VEKTFELNTPERHLDIQYDLFRVQTSENRSAEGLEQILEEILLNEEVLGLDRCQKEIDRLFKASINVIQPGEFLASLVISLISIGRRDDAVYFAKNFDIPGRAFIKSLKKLSLKNDLRNIETFADLLEDVYYSQLVKRKRKVANANLPNPVPEEENAELPPENVAVGYLIEIFCTRYKTRSFDLSAMHRPKRKIKMQKYEVDIHQLNLLSKSLMSIWSREAESICDERTISNLIAYAKRNKIKLLDSVQERCDRIMVLQKKSRNSLKELSCRN